MRFPAYSDALNRKRGMEGNGRDPLLLCLCSRCEGGGPPCLALGLASVNCKSQPRNVGVGVILEEPCWVPGGCVGP